MQEWETIETRTFVYDDWNLIHETICSIDGGTTNATEGQYFWGLDLSGKIQGAGGVGGLLAVSRNGQLYFPTFDNNGNVTKYIDESGNVVAAYEYDDFGRTISQSGSLAGFFRHRFSTKYYDPETGLYYYGYRFYHPILMSWLNRDPIEEAGCYNLNVFCQNNAVSSFDPFGLTRVDINVGTAEFEGKMGMREFIKIEAMVIEPPENGGKLNFIQLKRRDGEDWSLDIQNTPGPYYLTMIDVGNYTKRDKDGNTSIPFVTRRMQFNVAFRAGSV